MSPVFGTSPGHKHARVYYASTRKPHGRRVWQTRNLKLKEKKRPLIYIKGFYRRPVNIISVWIIEIFCSRVFHARFVLFLITFLSSRNDIHLPVEKYGPNFSRQSGLILICTILNDLNITKIVSRNFFVFVLQALRSKLS